MNFKLIQEQSFFIAEVECSEHHKTIEYGSTEDIVINNLIEKLSRLFNKCAECVALMHMCPSCKKTDCVHMDSKPTNDTVTMKRTISPPPPILPEVKIETRTDWVYCNLCKAKVYAAYLTRHLKVHTHVYDTVKNSDAVSGTESMITGKPATTALTLVRPLEEKSVPTNTVVPPPIIPMRVSAEPKPPIKPKIDSVIPYRFRKFENATCASSVSKSGRYSDFTLILWENDKPSAPVSTVNYTGGHTTTYGTRDWERFSIHIVYDSLEDYYTISCKLLKRGTYSTWDTEDTVPDRICFQNEICTEVKRALLYFRISPRVSYLLFRRLFNQEMIIDRDENGKAVVVQSKNSEELIARMKKTTQHHQYNGMYS